MAFKLLLSTFIISIFFTTCDAGFIEDILSWLFGFGAGKRSLSQVITSYLDSIFKKDDLDSELLKQLYMIYSNEDDTGFNSNVIGLQENV